jgi:hypothetical protein
VECSNVQGKLSVYIEGMVSPEEKKLIDEHISSCSKCKEALYDLKKTLDYVHNLEDIEPPAWLTQKVMARIRSDAEPKRGILQKLFYPLYIKLPIEAVAVVLIAVTAIYIFKIIQPEIVHQKIPSEVATQIPSKEKEVIHVHPPLIPPLVRGNTEGSKGAKGRFEAEQAMPAKKPDTIDKSAETPKAPTQVLREAEVPSDTRPSAGAVARDESRIEVLSRTPESKSLTETKEEIIGFTIHVKDVEIAIKEIEESLIQHGAKIVKIEHLDNKDTVTAKIESQKLKQLITEFKYIGEVEEKTTTFKTNQGIIEILIEIVRM